MKILCQERTLDARESLREWQSTRILTRPLLKQWQLCRLQRSAERNASFEAIVKIDTALYGKEMRCNYFFLSVTKKQRTYLRNRIPGVENAKDRVENVR